MSDFEPVRTSGGGSQLVRVNAGIGEYARPRRRPRYEAQPGAVLAELTNVHVEGFDSTIEIIAYAPERYRTGENTLPTLFAMEIHNVLVSSVSSGSYSFTGTLAAVDGYSAEDYPLIAEQLCSERPFLEDVADLRSRHGGIRIMPPPSVVFEKLIGMPVDLKVSS